MKQGKIAPYTRRPKASDLVGRKITKFRRDADNHWTFGLDDGAVISVWSENIKGLAIMEAEFTYPPRSAP